MKSAIIQRPGSRVQHPTNLYAIKCSSNNLFGTKLKINPYSLIFVKKSIMQTIRLRVSNKIYKNLMWFLERFQKDEIQIITENSEYITVKEYLTKEVQYLEEGKADFISVEELDKELEKTIQKHETEDN